jgi:hypothetical protein
MLQIHQFEDQFIAVAEKIPVLGFGAACWSRHAIVKPPAGPNHIVIIPRRFGPDFTAAGRVHFAQAPTDAGYFIWWPDVDQFTSMIDTKNPFCIRQAVADQ